MQNARNFRARFEPARHLEPGALMLGETRCKRTQSAQAQVGLLRAGADAQQVLGAGDVLVRRGRSR